MYIHKDFPKYVYHKIEKPKVVNSEEELKELGKDWKETPIETENEIEAEKPKKKPKAKDSAQEEEGE